MTGPRVPYVAVVGPGEDASSEAVDDAASVGRLIAQRGWITLTGGRAAGVMAAAAAGASGAGGTVVGILPGADRDDAATGLTIALPTGLGEARNAVLVTAADAVIACGINAGTLSEIALAMKAGKPVALVRPDARTKAFFDSMGANGCLHIALSSEDAVAWVGECGTGQGNAGGGTA